MAFYPSLMELFHPILDTMTVTQKEAFKREPSAFKNGLQERFLEIFRLDVDVDLLLGEMFLYFERYGLEQSYFLADPKERAVALAEIFAHYMQNRVEPSKETGIAIFETHIAGTSHIPNITEIAQNLKEGERLKLEQEKQNPFDKNAIKVLTLSGTKLGYIPKEKTDSPNYLFLQGYELFGVFKRAIWDASGVKLKMIVYVGM